MKCGQFEVGIFLPARHKIIIVRAVKLPSRARAGASESSDPEHGMTVFKWRTFCIWSVLLCTSAECRDDIIVLSIQSNQPIMLRHQVKTFRTFLEESIRDFLVVLKDLPSKDMESTYFEVCQDLDLICISVPVGEEWDEWNAGYGFERDGSSWLAKGASWLHGQAINWAWQEIVIQRYPESTILLTEQDVFLFSSISALDLLAQPDSCKEARSKRINVSDKCSHDCNLAGVRQSRRNQDDYEVEYLHPSFLVIDVACLPRPTSLFFGPSSFNGSLLDTGGSIAEYVSAMSEAWDEGSGTHVSICHLHQRALESDTCFWEFRAELGLPDSFAGAVLHLSRSSGWAGPVDPGVIRARDACLWRTLDDAVAR
jgi:hypothetical protein